MRRLTEEDASAAMRRSLPAEATLKIVETGEVRRARGTARIPRRGSGACDSRKPRRATLARTCEVRRNPPGDLCGRGSKLPFEYRGSRRQGPSGRTRRSVPFVCASKPERGRSNGQTCHAHRGRGGPGAQSRVKAGSIIPLAVLADRSHRAQGRSCNGRGPERSGPSPIRGHRGKRRARWRHGRIAEPIQRKNVQGQTRLRPQSAGSHHGGAKIMRYWAAVISVALILFAACLGAAPDPKKQKEAAWTLPAGSST